VAGGSVSFSDVDVSIPGQSGTAPTRSVYGWIIIHQRVDNNGDWYLGWDPYRDGFGDRNSDFWFGLEKVHRLTDSQSYRLRVEMRLTFASGTVILTVLGGGHCHCPQKKWPG